MDSDYIGYPMPIIGEAMANTMPTKQSRAVDWLLVSDEEWSDYYTYSLVTELHPTRQRSYKPQRWIYIPVNMCLKKSFKENEQIENIEQRHGRVMA